MPSNSPSHPLTHFNTAGDAHMVDVGSKPASQREATAQGRIHMQLATLDLIQSGQSRKGDVLGVARIAAIMACKRTAELIPLCHPLVLSYVGVDFDLDATECTVVCSVRCETIGSTGVEMEALAGVQVGLLTIYDMCKAADKGMVMQGIRLIEKKGGRSGHWQA